MFELKKNNLTVSVILVAIFISYIIGFYFNEDSAGGGKIDYINHEWGTIQLFLQNDLKVALNSILYESSRTPLFYIINKHIAGTYNIEGLRLFWFIFSLIIPFLFYLTLKLIVPKKIDKSYILLFSFVIFLSPYFRSNAYWPSSENLQIFFVILSLFFYIFLIKNKNIDKSRLYILSILSILSAYCAFYTDQKAFFLVALIYFDLIRRNDLPFFLIFSFLNVLLFLPAIYLFISWGGLVPIESQFRVSKFTQGSNIFISTIGIYFVLVFISNFFNSNFWKITKLQQIDFFFIFIISIFLFFSLPSIPITFGSGIISKLLGIITVKFNLNWDIIKYIYFFINLFFIVIIFLLTKKTFKNLIIFSSFLLVYNLTSITYQSYLDPVIYIILLTVFDFKKNIDIFNIKTSYLFLIFYSSMLVSSIILRTYII